MLQEHISGNGVNLYGTYSAVELLDWAEKYGLYTVRWVKEKLSRFEFEVQSYPPITLVLPVLNKYGSEAAERVSEVALASAVFTVKGFKNILSAQAKLHTAQEKIRFDLNAVFCVHTDEEDSAYANY